MTQYFYFVGTEKIGPVSAKEIRDATAIGVILPDTLIELDDGRQSIARNIRGISFPEPPTKRFEVPVVPIIPCVEPKVYSEEIPSEKEFEEENDPQTGKNKTLRLMNYLRTGVSVKILIVIGVVVLFLSGLVFFLCSYTSPENLRREGIYVMENSMSGNDLLKEENAPKSGFRLLTKAAKKGDTLALLYLAHCYGSGIGVEEDKHEALNLIQKASDKDCPEALMVLASLYAEGEMVQKNEEEAKKYHNKANQLFLENIRILREKAKQGNRNAQYDLGNYYFQGFGVTKDINEAMKWWEAAEKKGYKISGESKVILQMYHAAQNGKPDEQYEFAKLLYYSDEKGDSVSWFEMAANQGNVDAMFCLGYLLEDYLVKGTSKTQFEWLVTAAEHGHAEAQCEIGSKYLLGDEEEGIERSKELAEKWLLAAAKQKNKEAYFLLGLLYRYSDKEEAARWFIKCGEDNETAMKCLRELNL